MAGDGDLRPLGPDEAPAILAVINEAAARYRGVIPPEADTDPYMPMAELQDELETMAFVGVDTDDLVGVIGVQAVADVTLIRHLYVHPDAQRQGLGSRLLRAALDRAATETVLVGTWAAAAWAIAFYEAHGFDRADDPGELLDTYWEIPPHQRDASVVLRYGTE